MPQPVYMASLLSPMGQIGEWPFLNVEDAQKAAEALVNAIGCPLMVTCRKYQAETPQAPLTKTQAIPEDKMINPLDLSEARWNYERN